jgi:large subunit ribosomal protein L30
MAVDAKKLTITLRRSGIGCTQRQRETLRGLGLTRIGKTSVRADTVSLRGMLRKVDHLIEVRENGSE